MTETIPLENCKQLFLYRDAIQLLDHYSIFFEHINLLHINVRKNLLEQNP